MCKFCETSLACAREFKWKRSCGYVFQILHKCDNYSSIMRIWLLPIFDYDFCLIAPSQCMALPFIMCSIVKLVGKLAHSLSFIMYHIYPYFQLLIVGGGGVWIFPQTESLSVKYFQINIHDLLWTPSQNLPPPLPLENWPSSTAEYYRLDCDSLFVATLKLYM